MSLSSAFLNKLNSVRELNESRLVAKFLWERGFLSAAGWQAEGAVVSALKAFQTWYGLVPTGKLDPVTVGEMVKPRCGCRSVTHVTQSSLFSQVERKIPETVGCVWGQGKIILRVAIGVLTQDEEEGKVLAEIALAFKEWERTKVFEFRLFVDYKEADIVVGWPPDSGGLVQMTGDIIARSDFPPGCSEIVSSPPFPIIFEDHCHRWAEGNVSEAFDIRSVLVHEIGHMLGLDHSSRPSSVMRDTFLGGIEGRSLSDGDIELLQRLYGKLPNNDDLVRLKKRSEGQFGCNPISG